jgi:hypothetical protein
MSDTVKKIRKVVTHVPTGKQWATQGFPFNAVREDEYGKWLIRVLNDDTPAFTLPTGLNDKHSRQTLFNEELLKQCVIEVEVYEERDE